MGAGEFEKAMEIKRKIKTLEGNSSLPEPAAIPVTPKPAEKPPELKQLKQDLRSAMAAGEFEKAVEIKKKITALEKK